MIHNGPTHLRGTMKAAVTLTIGGAGGAPVALAITCHGLPCEIIAALTAILITAIPAVVPHLFRIWALRMILQSPAEASQAAPALLAILAQAPGTDITAEKPAASSSRPHRAHPYHARHKKG